MGIERIRTLGELLVEIRCLRENVVELMNRLQIEMTEETGDIVYSQLLLIEGDLNILEQIVEYLHYKSIQNT